MRVCLLVLIGCLGISQAAAQVPDSTRGVADVVLDSLFIDEVENIPGERPKVLHAEPLYIDLIRDLGARKGEKEWNFGFGVTDELGYDSYELLVEYEWAVADRLGLELEAPFTFFGRVRNGEADQRPANRMESMKVAAQWSFLVNEELSTSLALGYIHEFELSSFDRFGDPLFRGNIYNPFLVAAKRWGSNWHTLVYTGPRIEQTYTGNKWDTRYEVNSNLHYMVPGTRNFIGLEFNKQFRPGDMDGTLRPQMRVSLADNFLVGIVTGIPISREEERFSMFTRLIWEPGHKH